MRDDGMSEKFGDETTLDAEELQESGLYEARRD